MKEKGIKLISYDLGTGGVKASLYNEKCETITKTFYEYETYYPKPNFHEQKPLDWWKGVITCTKDLLVKSGIKASDIKCIALSGHSLITVPIDKDRKELLEQVPIWSDTRAQEETKEFFSQIDETAWYLKTGNGFPAPCYSIFKLMWLKKNMPEIYEKTYKILGSKDYINFKLTNQIYTDYSYASGSGAYDLINKKMIDEYIDAAGLKINIFPEIIPSHYIVGTVTKEAAEITGLCEKTAVACGGVDNACMALGAIGVEKGGIYASLGSSSWIPVNTETPLLDSVRKPYVFAHIEEGMYTSAFSIFSGGNSLHWAKDTLCKDIINDSNVYNKMDKLAAKAPIGSGHIFFNPSLAGGTSQDKSINTRGAYLGLHLGTTREDMLRASMEGIAFNLRTCLENLKHYAPVSSKILFSGGGSKSDFWMQMFADIFNMEIINTNIDQDTASVGAMAIAARAIGLWKDYTRIGSLHHVERRYLPIPDNVQKYDQIYTTFTYTSVAVSDIGDYMSQNLLFNES